MGCGPGLLVGVGAGPVLPGVAADHRGQLARDLRLLAGGREQRVRQPGGPAGQHPASLRLPGGLVERLGRVWVPGDAVEHRVQQHQPADPVRGGQRCLHHHPAAERQPGQHRLPEVKVIQQGNEVTGVGVGGGRVERARGTEPAAVVAHHPEASGQMTHLRVPHPHVQPEAVDEHHGRALAGHLIRQAGTRPYQHPRRGRW